MKDPREDFKGWLPGTVAEAEELLERVIGLVGDIQYLSIVHDKRDVTQYDGWKLGYAMAVMAVAKAMGVEYESLTCVEAEDYTGALAGMVDVVGESMYGEPELWADGTLSGSPATEEEQDMVVWRSPTKFYFEGTVIEGGYLDEVTSEEVLEKMEKWHGATARVTIELPHSSEVEAEEQRH